MNKISLALIIALTAINTFAFLLMLLDKVRAEKGRHDKRIKEVTLFFLAALFGGIGIYLGMSLFRHKNRKWHFYIGIPILVIQNVGFIFLLYKFLFNVI